MPVVSDKPDLILTAPKQRVVWVLTGLAAVTGAVAVFLNGTSMLPDEGARVVVIVALGFCLLFGVIGAYLAALRVYADDRGVRTRTPFRRRSIFWSDVVEVCVTIHPVYRSPDQRRVTLRLTDGTTRTLPLPYDQQYGPRNEQFDVQVEQLRALHARYGSGSLDALDSSPRVVPPHPLLHPTVIIGLVCAVFALPFAAILVFLILPHTAETERAWERAVSCTDATPSDDVRECLFPLPGKVEATNVDRGFRSFDSWVSFTDGRPVKRVEVSVEAAEAFRAGDDVEVTFWRGKAMTIAGDRYVWNKHVTPARDVWIGAGVSTLAGTVGLIVAVRRSRSVAAARRPDVVWSGRSAPGVESRYPQ